MALIKCPECGKEISDKAASCIHCGCPLQATTPQVEQSTPSAPLTTEIVTQKKQKQIIAAILAVIPFVMTLYVNHFQNQEIIGMVKALSGGMLVYFAMVVCIVAAILYILPSNKGFKASCSIIIFIR